MKTTRIILLSLLLVSYFNALPQPGNSQDPTIKTYPLEITYNKTSSIIFASVIKSVDRGSRDVLAQKAKGVDNILQLKAARTSFPETNLTVITADGILHQFKVSYSERPSKLITDLGGAPEAASNSQLIFQSSMTESEMDRHATEIIGTKRALRFDNEKKYKMSLSLLGIYIYEDVMFFRFRIANNSNINYDVDFLMFQVQDKSRIKRTASQEVEIKPLYVFGNDKVIKGKSSSEIIYAMKKLTIPEAKKLHIELFESGGGRNLSLDISNRTIENAGLLR